MSASTALGRCVSRRSRRRSNLRTVKLTHYPPAAALAAGDPFAAQLPLPLPGPVASHCAAVRLQSWPDRRPGPPLVVGMPRCSAARPPTGPGQTPPDGRSRLDGGLGGITAARRQCAGRWVRAQPRRPLPDRSASPMTTSSCCRCSRGEESSTLVLSTSLICDQKDSNETCQGKDYKKRKIACSQASCCYDATDDECVPAEFALHAVAPS